ncbi:MAG TPA: rhodanese-like domain-containing protein [Gammaproteobacteria bacterium]|nr:rhodanese-like domain-containing protein [Gammaproteobacteria bacterium]
MQLPPAIVGKGILASFMGFIRHLLSLAAHNLHVGWGIMTLFMLVGALGSFAGQQIAGRLPHPCSGNYSVCSLCSWESISSGTLCRAYCNQWSSNMTTAADLVSKAKSKIREVTPQDVTKNRDKLVIIDVREPGEYAAGHIPDVANIPRGLIEFKVDNHPLLSDRDMPLVLHCKGGGRSALATVALQELGFKNVVNMTGGFDAWQSAGLPVSKS